MKKILLTLLITVFSLSTYAAQISVCVGAIVTVCMTFEVTCSAPWGRPSCDFNIRLGSVDGKYDEKSSTISFMVPKPVKKGETVKSLELKKDVQMLDKNKRPTNIFVKAGMYYVDKHGMVTLKTIKKERISTNKR